MSEPCFRVGHNGSHYIVQAATYTSNGSPDCSAVTASPSLIEQPKRDQFELVTLFGSTDPDGNALTHTIDAVTQDEPVTAKGDDTSPDAIDGTAPSNVRIRSEANARGNGRAYRIAFTVSDGNGGSCQATAGPGGTTTATARVRRKKGEAVVDDGDTQSFDSFTGAPIE